MGTPLNILSRNCGKKTGEDVDPASVVEYLQRNDLPVHPVSEAATSPSADFSEAMERDIELALVSQLDTLGLRLFIDQDGRSGQQHAAGEFGRIDIVATDANGDFVVIELKREALRVAIGQLAGYIAYVRKHLAKPAGRSAVGWILARPSSSVDDRLLEEAAEAVGIQVRWYRVRVELLGGSITEKHGSPSAVA